MLAKTLISLTLITLVVSAGAVVATVLSRTAPVVPEKAGALPAAAWTCGPSTTPSCVRRPSKPRSPPRWLTRSA